MKGQGSENQTANTEESGYLIIQLVVLLLTLANQSAMMPSGKPCGDDEASTFKEMEALRVSGQWARLEKMWAAQRLAGILLLARNCQVAALSLQCR